LRGSRPVACAAPAISFYV